MNKKRIVTLLMAGVLTLGVVGGTFAWFTSQDTVTNSFETLGNNGGDHRGDIEIGEEFDNDGAKKLLPGDECTKEVWVSNVADYHQFIRVSLQKSIGPNSSKEVDLALIELNMLNVGNSSGQWVKGEDKDKNGNDWYYYIEAVSAGSATKDILKSVTFNFNAEDSYKNIDFDVIVNAESVQAKNGAYKEVWKDAGDTVKGLLETAQIK